VGGRARACELDEMFCLLPKSTLEAPAACSERVFAAGRSVTGSISMATTLVGRGGYSPLPNLEV
jgi:hypothetical protein